ncbi:hypothetical protein [Pararhodobacter zhoushanensis]|uniref:Uncharacterized protein n=1 Tax=Pararhodobacter zhoushanensis TaxID=2479545 RepID=A0ABT3H1M8_9RHOB|nr:hypothetical protein [Pararhodobacter zhoushanensis]MCW1933600.1 hypothetical protein [Pararhodobacter zhoushanensis]
MAQQAVSDGMERRIGRLLAAEIAAFDASSPVGALTLEAFQRRRVKRHRAITVNFSGGITQTCWTVIRSDGCYSVIFLPDAGYFSLCVDSDFGPLDIGVHGAALGCFASV